MELTTENVETVFMDCLFKDGENSVDAVIVEGIANKLGFHPERVKAHSTAIHSMLQQLPEQFQEKGGGGWSFLNACQDKNGNQWTDLHQRMEQLFCLGLAIGKVKRQLPREMWSALPGGMPYYVVYS